MSKSVRRSTVIAGIAVLSMLLAACSTGTTDDAAETTATAASESTTAQESADEGAALPKMWYINVLTSYELYNVAQALFEESASTLGYEANTAGSATVDVPEQITLIEQAIATGAEAIIYCNVDPPTYEKTVKAAQAEGVIMITTGGCVDDYSDYSIGTDNVTFGEVAAQTVAAQVGEDAQVIAFATNESVPNQVAQLNSFKDYAAKNYPNMKIISTQYTDADAAKAALKIPAALAAFPEANAMWFVEGAGVSAVPKSLEQAGKKPGEIYVLGVDSTPETLKSIEDGWVSSTLAQCFFYATPFAADLALKKLNGEGPSQQSWPVGVVPVGPADLPFAGCPESAYPTIQ